MSHYDIIVDKKIFFPMFVREIRTSYSDAKIVFNWPNRPAGMPAGEIDQAVEKTLSIDVTATQQNIQDIIDAHDHDTSKATWLAEQGQILTSYPLAESVPDTSLLQNNQFTLYHDSTLNNIVMVTRLGDGSLRKGVIATVPW